MSQPINKTTCAATAVVVVALAGVGAFFYWQHQQQQRAAVAAAAAAAPAVDDAAAPAAVEPASSAASEPGIQHPIAAPVADAASAPPSIDGLLAGLFDRQTMLSMFQTQDFPRRVVATVDNLGRAHAPIALWPVNPTPGRFSVVKQDGAEVMVADNAARYTPFVALAESVDLAKVVAVYTRIYPQLQRAYEDIGFPRRYFNDRLVAVIDLLLATPDVAGPIKVHLPPINGPVKREQPWASYEFDDPALQSLSSGQRILLRVGPDNERRLKARLTELRRLVATGGGKP